MPTDRWRVLWSITLPVATIVAYQPKQLLTLVWLPICLASGLITALLAHVALAYFADRATTGFQRTDARSTTYEPVVPLLSIATPAGLEAIKVRKAWAKTDTSYRQPLHPTSLKVSAALDDLIATLLSNHLLSWYTIAISPSDPSFPNAVEKTIREVLVEARKVLAEVDWAKLGVSTLLPKITNHLEHFLEAQQSLLESTNPQVEVQETSHKNRGKKQSPGATVASEELDLLLANKYAELAGKRGLHPAVSGASFNSRPSEEKHLRNLVHRILKLLMPAREAGSPAVMTIAKEIVACAVMRPAIEALSDPDLWNRIIDEKAGAIIREQRMVNKLREALDANPSVPDTPLSAGRKQASDISIHSTTKDFELFLKSLRRCPNLLEAKRLRNDIEASLRRTRLPGSYAEETPPLVSSYIKRLSSAKQVIDKRISDLGGQDAPSRLTAPTACGAVTLRDILHQPGAMSFFMEFMDRRSRVILPQFFLTIEGLKDPLEELEIVVDSPSSSLSSDASLPIDIKAAQALREDVLLLLSTFLRSKAVSIEASALEALEDFYSQEGHRKGKSMSRKLYNSVRRRIFSAQMEIYDDMNENDWPIFKRSDLYNKAIAEMPPPILYGGASDMMKASTNRARAMSLDRQTSAMSKATTKSTGITTASSITDRRPSGRNITSHRSISGDNTAGMESNAPFKSDKIDFLTGAASRSADNLAVERSPLFAEDGDAEALLFVDDEAETIEQLQTMDAIHDALTSILEDDTRRRSTALPSSPASLRSRESATSSPARHQLLKRATSPTSIGAHNPEPTLSTPKVTRAKLHGRDASGHSQNDEQGSDLEGDEKLSDNEDLSSSALRLAAPGNLQLPAEIERISGRIDKLKNQETVLATLLRKAELTGNKDEIKILVKSIDALRREVSELSFQRRQFETQADENKLLPGRTAVDITGTTVGQSQGKDFALYLVEVRQLAEDGKTQISGWLVTRRFSEFVALHAKLREKLPRVKSLDLPQKRIVTSMSNSLLQQRKQGLAKYLRSLVQIPGALANRDVRAFLSQQNISLLQAPSNSAIGPLGSDIFPGQGVIRNLFRTVTSGMDDMFGGPSMLDAIILRLSQQATDFAGSLTPSVQSEDLISSILGGFAGASTGRAGVDVEADGLDLLSLPSDIQTAGGEGLTSFTSPIANFLVEVFDLKEKGSWLRRQAIVIILQQVLGGTIERKVREAVALSLSGDALAPHIDMLKDLMWPGGKMRPASPPRSPEEKLRTREAAFRKLTYLMPDVAASLIGRSNALRGARRVFAMMQNRRLLQHLIYTLLDDVVEEIFGSAMLAEAD